MRDIEPVTALVKPIQRQKYYKNLQKYSDGNRIIPSVFIRKAIVIFIKITEFYWKFLILSAMCSLPCFLFSSVYFHIHEIKFKTLKVACGWRFKCLWLSVIKLKLMMSRPLNYKAVLGYPQNPILLKIVLCKREMHKYF